jgi:histidyl-tRNA synthetase
VIVGERERADGMVVLRNMRNREERRVAQAEAAAAVKDALG